VAPAPAAAAAPAAVAAPALAPAPAPAPVYEPRPPRRRGPPEANRGFQMHFTPLLAMSFPFGAATDEPHDSLRSRYGWQWVPFDVGVGAKPIDELYVGGYLNLGVGYEGSDLTTEKRCEAGDDVSDDVSCSSDNVHAGLEVRYTFTPAESSTGWLGYGVGITSATQSISDASGYRESSTVRGIDWARVSGGVDFRLARGFGLGPFAVVHIGRYTHQRTEIREVVTFSGAIDDQAFHAWLTLGLRLVVFP
jgi:opacity protein-like surface antigen